MTLFLYIRVGAAVGDWQGDASPQTEPGTARVGCNPFPSFANSIARREGDVCRGEPSGFPSARRVSVANGSIHTCRWQVWHKAKDLDEIVEVLLCVGAFLSSRAATSQVLSAQVSLTAVFGMGTGVPSPPSAPTLFQDHTLKTE